jgi:hypothetical protein
VGEREGALLQMTMALDEPPPPLPPHPPFRRRHFWGSASSGTVCWSLGFFSIEDGGSEEGMPGAKRLG